MTEARQKIWSSKVSGITAGAPKLCSLPPTNEAFLQNVFRAHFQIAVWRNALEPNPPCLDPCAYGWAQDGDSLIPTAVPEATALAPNDLLKLIKCGCSTEQPCNTMRCGCSKANLACTLFCSCKGGQSCFNDQTKQAQQFDDDDDNNNNF